MKEHYFKDHLYYRINDFKSNRQNLVFVHGLSGSSSAWLEYEKFFKEKYNVLTLDIRGHGKSKKFPYYPDYEIKHFAEDLNDLVLHLNIPKFILISHSFGTLIAMEYIKSYREKVTVNVLLSPIIDLNKEPSAKFLRPILKPTKILDLFPFHPKPGQHVDYSKYFNTTDWNLKRCYADVSNTTFRVYFHCLRQSLIKEQEYFLEKINVPTLIVHGMKDTLAPVKNSIALSKKIKNSKLVLIPGTDHIVVLNNFKEISKIIEDFLIGIG